MTTGTSCWKTGNRKAAYYLQTLFGPRQSAEKAWSKGELIKTFLCLKAVSAHRAVGECRRSKLGVRVLNKRLCYSSNSSNLRECPIPRRQRATRSFLLLPPRARDLAYRIKLCARGQQRQNEKLQSFRTGETIHLRQKPVLCCQYTQQIFSDLKLHIGESPCCCKWGCSHLTLSHSGHLGDETYGIPESVWQLKQNDNS